MPTQETFEQVSFHPATRDIPQGKLRNLVVLRGRGWDAAPGRERRLRNIDVIEARARAAGLPITAAAAMVANAWAESQLNDQARRETPKEMAYGLFQLSSKDFTPATPQQMRKGTRSQRLNPVFNTDYMLWEVQGKPGYWFRRRAQEGASPSELAVIFARDIERCAACGDAHRGLGADGHPKVIRNPYRPTSGDPESALKTRAQTARWMFPTLFAPHQTAPTQTTPKPPPAQKSIMDKPWFWPAVGLAVFAVFTGWGNPGGGR